MEVLRSIGNLKLKIETRRGNETYSSATPYNICDLSPEISGKRLELLREVVPRLSGLAVLGNSTNPGNAEALKETELAAGAAAA
jgi:hypothetical protein